MTRPDRDFRCWFVGVRTEGSAAVTAFPDWLQALGLDGGLETIDLPLDSPGEAYRRLVERLRETPDVRGMVVTAHKARLFEEAATELDELDELARLCREVSVVRRSGDRLVGSAIEPRSVAGALAEIVSPSHWAETDGRILALGAGATTTALMVHLYALADDTDAPSIVSLVDVRVERAEALRESLERWRPGLHVLTPTPEEAIAVLRELPPGSLVVNGTGLGKDRPGSPLPSPAPWPRGALVWDLNYRGELRFLEDARRAADGLGLRVHDGWGLFLHGWSEALGCILGRRLSETEFTALEHGAQRARASRP
jgi:shikimate 5-dehydrogenase